MDANVIRMSRILTKAEADGQLGSTVPALEPNMTEASIVYDSETDEPIFAYLPVARPIVAALRKAVLSVKYATTKRAGTGMNNASRTFGMSPRKPLAGRDSCRPYTLAMENPSAHQTIVSTANTLKEMLQETFPDMYEHDKSVVDAIPDEWKMMEDSLWTSGVINKSSTLPYHRDAFNFQTWSAMPVVRRNVRGGYLHVPEYDIIADCRDGWSVFFPGYRLIHGVTPMEQSTEDGYRYSVVYYALRGMKDCFTYAMETAHAQEKRTEREAGIASALRGERPFITEKNLKSLRPLKGLIAGD